MRVACTIVFLVCALPAWAADFEGGHLVSGPLVMEPEAVFFHVQGKEIYLTGVALTGSGVLALQNWLDARPVSCLLDPRQHASVDGVCEVDGADLGAWLVRNGHGAARGDRYAVEEAWARRRAAGMWGR